MTAPAQPEQPLRQRIDATIRPRMLIGLQDAELYDEPGRERIGEWADSITSWVLAEVEPELAKSQQRGDIWKAKTAAMEQDRDRLAAELDALREQAERYQVGALERAALLEDARDALEAAGVTGAHGDDWPAIAPAIRALAAERDARDAEIQQLRAQLADAEQALASERARTGQRRRATQGAVEEAEQLRAELAARPGCPDPIECDHEAALGQAEEELARLRALFAEAHAAAYHQGEPRDRHCRCTREGCPGTDELPWLDYGPRPTT